MLGTEWNFIAQYHSESGKIVSVLARYQQVPGPYESEYVIIEVLLKFVDLCKTVTHQYFFLRIPFMICTAPRLKIRHIELLNMITFCAYF